MEDIGNDLVFVRKEKKITTKENGGARLDYPLKVLQGTVPLSDGDFGRWQTNKAPLGVFLEDPQCPLRLLKGQRLWGHGLSRGQVVALHIITIGYN